MKNNNCPIPYTSINPDSSEVHLPLPLHQFQLLFRCSPVLGKAKSGVIYWIWGQWKGRFKGDAGIVLSMGNWGRIGDIRVNTYQLSLIFCSNSWNPSNKNVFRLFLNSSTSVSDLIFNGSKFHSFGATLPKDLLPYEPLKAG